MRSDPFVHEIWINPLELLAALTPRSATMVPWPQFTGREVYWTHTGQIAIWNVLKSWGVGPGVEVLAPSYNCGSEIDPAHHLGAEVRMYRVDSNLQIDFEDVLQKLSPKTKVLHITHFFGWPNGIEPIRNELEERGIRILEDCALSLFSCDEDIERGIGRMGDMAIYSFTKFLAVPDGGAITLAKPVETRIRLHHPPPRARLLQRNFALTKKFVLAQVPGARELRGWLRNRKATGVSIDQEPQWVDIPDDHYFNEDLCHDRMSRLTQNLLRRVDREEVKRIRRENYKRLLEGIQGLPGIELIKPDLPHDICPLSMPILVNDRAMWRRALMERGILAHPWWAGYHRGFDWSEFPEARKFKECTLTLPIHQCLRPEHMDYTAKVIRDFSSKLRI